MWLKWKKGLKWKVWKMGWSQKAEKPASQLVKSRQDIIFRRKHWKDIFQEIDITGLREWPDGGEGQRGVSQGWFPVYWMTSAWSLSISLSVPFIILILSIFVINPVAQIFLERSGETLSQQSFLHPSSAPGSEAGLSFKEIRERG